MYAFALNICKLSYSNKKYFIVEENYYINLNYKDSIIINVVTITKKKLSLCATQILLHIFYDGHRNREFLHILQKHGTFTGFL